jgi:hypothetical protein
MVVAESAPVMIADAPVVAETTLLNVCSVHYNSVASITDKSLIKIHEYIEPIRYWRQYSWGSCTAGYTLSEEQATVKRLEDGQWFKTKFVDHCNKGWYYQFIVTTQQLECFMEDIEKFDFIKYMVYKSKQPAVNGNYLYEGPKLHAFLFYIPEDK